MDENRNHDPEGWGPSIRAICRATSYEHYLELVIEEAAAEVVAEAEAALR